MSIKWILTLLHSERPKFYTSLAFLSAIGLRHRSKVCCKIFCSVELSADIMTNQASLCLIVIFLGEKIYSLCEEFCG